MASRTSFMQSNRGEDIALTEVSIRAQLQDLLVQVEVSQSYRNDETTNIEASYTFAIPMDGVLLDLEVQLDDRLLKGEVTAKSEAEERYESAIGRGDTAVMLEQIEPGLYNMDVGNLAAGETAIVRFTYTVMYRWSGSQFRFFLPTTIAPRDGEAQHEPHQAAKHSLTVENKFSLEIEVFGALRDARFLDPSFPCVFLREGERAFLKLQAEKAVMDRDFVVTVESKEAERSFAIFDQDIEGVAAIASFQPFFPGLSESRALELIVIVDCSGSMAGDSIEQAKKALAELLNQVGPQDHITVVAFGSTQKAVSKKLLACSPNNVKKLKAFCEELEADLEGTDIEAALEFSFKIAAGAPACDLFMITDGEITYWESIVDKASGFGHRVFTVGVGSAVAEAFVRSLASETGAACELVMPTEAMATRIVRHFERLRAPKAKNVRILWPDGAAECTPAELGAVFDGDSITASARLTELSDGAQVSLELETESGNKSRQALTLGRSALRGTEAGPSTIARLAAASRMRQATDDVARAIALSYQLTSRHTNWIVVVERCAEKRLDASPELRIVPQTLAAGWGGTGSVKKRYSRISATFSMPALIMGGGAALSSKMLSSASTPPTQKISASMGSGTVWRDPRSAQPDEKGVESLPESFDVAAFLSGDADGSSSSGKTAATGLEAIGAGAAKRLQLDPESRVAGLIALIQVDQSWLAVDRSIDLLEAAGFINDLDQIERLISHKTIRPDLAAQMLLIELLTDAVIALFPAEMQGYIRAVRREGLENFHSALRIADRARVMHELLEREPHGEMIEPRFLRHASSTLQQLGELQSILLDLQKFVQNAASEAIRRGEVTAYG